MVYQKEVQISSSQTASLMFQNPSKSVNDIVLQLVITGSDGTETVIAQSGTLSPGYKVETLGLIRARHHYPRNLHRKIQRPLLRPGHRRKIGAKQHN